MSRQRTPTNVLEITGAFNKNPARRKAREGEPEPNAGIGPAPDHLLKSHKKVWDEIVSIVPRGVLGDCDRLALEMIVDSIIHFRKGTISDSRFNRLHIMLGSLGLTPADRSKVKRELPKQKTKESEHF